MTLELEKKAIAILYRTAYEYCHGIISGEQAIHILSAVNRMTPDSDSSDKIWKYTNRLTKSIVDNETKINWKISNAKRELWEKGSKNLYPLLNEETNLTLDEEFFTSLEY